VTVADPTTHAAEVLREMLHIYAGCGCGDLWGDPDDPETVAAFRHHQTTCVRAHPILSWESAVSSLWDHIDRVVQGVAGARLEPWPFIHGLFHHVLWYAPAEGGPVRL